MPEEDSKWYEDAFKAYQQAPGLLQMLPGSSGAFQAAPQMPLSPGLEQTPPTVSSPGSSEYDGGDMGIDQNAQTLDAILQELRAITRILQNAST